MRSLLGKGMSELLNKQVDTQNENFVVLASPHKVCKGNKKFKKMTVT